MATDDGRDDNEAGLVDSSPEPFSIQHISEANRFPHTPATHGKKRKLDMNMQREQHTKTFTESSWLFQS